MRLGFAVNVLSQPALKAYDSRRWQNNPHLSVSLAYVRDIMLYLRRTGIRMYRLSSDLAPYATHPELPRFHGQVEACRAQLAELGRLAREDDVRLSFHPAAYVLLNGLDEGTAARGVAELEVQAAMLDAMGLDDRAVVVMHGGGVYDDKTAAMERFVRRWERLGEAPRRRLVLENDERSYAVPDIRWLHERTGIRLVFDYLHFLNHNPQRLSVQEALGLCLETWPADVPPKVHFSSPRTEMRETEGIDPVTGRRKRMLKPPLWTQHADFVNPFEFHAFLEASAGTRDFDVMLEVKAKDLALLRLREDLRRFFPSWAMRLGFGNDGGGGPQALTPVV